MKKSKPAGSQKARRTAARLAAVQAVYQMTANGQGAASVLKDMTSHPPSAEEMDGAQMVTPDAELLGAIAMGVEERRSDLESLLSGTKRNRSGTGDGVAYAPGEPLLHAIMLCGAYELLAHRDTDAPLIISEYIDVSHAFFEQGESKLVNGVLDTIRKNVRDTA